MQAIEDMAEWNFETEPECDTETSAEKRCAKPRFSPASFLVRTSALNVNDEFTHLIRLVQFERKFRALVDEWYATYDRFSSDPTDWVLALPYQRVIALGEDAIPLILDELKRRPNHWFWALHVLSGEDPVAPENVGRFDEMVKSWLNWGKSRGYV